LGNLVISFNSKKIKNPRYILGGKGANLAKMGKLGLPVPPGFTISTEVCDLFYTNKKKLPKKILKNIQLELRGIEKIAKKKFGDLKNPLLVSVRSGARVSMPGMMDTILNLGLNDQTVKSLSKKTLNGRFAKDSYRRFIQMYSNVVLNIEGHLFEGMIDSQKLNKGVLLDTELEETDLDELIERFKELVKKQTKKSFPQNVEEQLYGAISFLIIGEQQLMYNLWYLEIWEKIVQQEWFSQEIPQPVKMLFLVSI
jgi:pyruvate,orthophosphate dikinase